MTRRTPTSGMAEARQDRPLARATLEIEADSGPLGGAVISSDGERFAFSGWAELAAAIEDWRAAERPRAT